MGFIWVLYVFLKGFIMGAYINIYLYFYKKYGITFYK